MTPQPFRVAIEGACWLTVDQVWPDGNAPENPTADDVVRRMRSGNTSNPGRLIREWNLPVEVTVDGLVAVEQS